MARTARPRLHRRPPVAALAICAGLAAAAAGLAAGVRHAAEPAGAAGRPNIVLILTDDMRYDELRFMPNVRRLIADHGVTFTNAVVSNSLCCPSRSTILTGDYAHTTHVYLNNGPNGGGNGFKKFHDDRSTIATWLQGAGYQTGLFGKYLNNYHAPYVPPGWTSFRGFNYGFRYYGGQLSIDGRAVTMPRTAYSTTYLGHMAQRFIESANPADPVFVYYAPLAPHQPTIPEPRYVPLVFPWLDRTLAADPAFDQRPAAGMPRYARTAPAVQPFAAYRFAQAQLRTLKSVDDEVGGIVAALRRTGRLSNTVLVFTSDNGVQWGEHRMLPASKSVPYEGSIHVPLVVRFDPAGRSPQTTDALLSNVDFAPTFAAAAGVAHPPVEGRSFWPLVLHPSRRWRRSGILIEHQYDLSEWRIGVAPSFCAVRTQRWMFAHYSDGEEELYSLATDPFELRNLARRDTRLTARLRARTRALCRPLPPDFHW